MYAENICTGYSDLSLYTFYVVLLYTCIICVCVCVCVGGGGGGGLHAIIQNTLTVIFN